MEHRSQRRTPHTDLYIGRVFKDNVPSPERLTGSCDMRSVEREELFASFVADNAAGRNDKFVRNESILPAMMEIHSKRSLDEAISRAKVDFPDIVLAKRSHSQEKRVTEAKKVSPEDFLASVDSARIRIALQKLCRSSSVRCRSTGEFCLRRPVSSPHTAPEKCG